MIPSLYIAGFLIAFVALSFALPPSSSIDKDDRLEYRVCIVICSIAWPLLIAWLVWKLLSFLLSRDDAEFKD